MCDSIAGELRAGRTVLLNTTGKSMRPLLKEGQTQVLVEPLRGSLRLGDLPLVEIGPGHYRLHRIIRVQNECYVTRGDNSIYKETVTAGQILGHVTQIRRGRRVLSLCARRYTLYWRLWLLLTPIRIPLYRLRGSLEGLLERRQRHGV